MATTDNSALRHSRRLWRDAVEFGKRVDDAWTNRYSKLLRWGLRYVAELLPKGLYTRTLIIIIAPIVLLQGVLAFVFMERHWQSVTRRLSEATARDIAAVVEIYKGYKKNDNHSSLIQLSRDTLNLSVQVLPSGDLPSVQPKPFFSLLDKTLSNEIRLRVRDTPFWIDTVGDSDHVEIKIKLKTA